MAEERVDQPVETGRKGRGDEPEVEGHLKAKRSETDDDGPEVEGHLRMSEPEEMRKKG